MSQHYSSIAQIFGTVVTIFDNDKFILQTDNGQIVIEADLPDSLSLNLTSGQKVTIKGNYDDNKFEATSITREDGSQVLRLNPLDDSYDDNNSNSLDDRYDNSNGLDDRYDNSNGLDNSYDNSNGLDDRYDNSNGLDNSYDNSNGLDDRYDNSNGLDNSYDNSNSLDDRYDDHNSNGLNDRYDDNNNSLDNNKDLFGINDDRQQETSHNSNIDSLFNTTVYRFQNSHIQGTFLFADETESDSIRHNYNEIFEEEGMAFRVANHPGDNLEAIYRMANKDIPGTYLYVGEEEKQNISQHYTNFENEGIAFYVLGANANQGEDVYRFQSVNNPGTYIFVLEQEKNNILANYSSLFTLEGVAFEVG